MEATQKNPTEDVNQKCMKWLGDHLQERIISKIDPAMLVQREGNRGIPFKTRIDVFQSNSQILTI